MPVSGRILRGSLSYVANTSGDARVSIVINGDNLMDHDIMKDMGRYSETTLFIPPIRLAQNDRINFRTVLDTANATNNIVSLLIELDL